ncbi:TetR/AcrR family transcriptional regulator [Solimonas flava]|uniref:TetR/AcrR family transcriptional regulator n=1 Tax=Solimonas flava TaxID=415849 RepID=UPI001377CEBA|nr:TetR/AcrR family transcriptional regulator [Solimonas flava]
MPTMKRPGGPRSAAPAATPRTRGRPRRDPEQEQRVRTELVAAARRLFADEGFEAVSMRRIADAAGCGAMTLYGYFRSKNDLLRHIWDDFFVEMFAQIARVTKRGTPRERLRKACLAYIDYWCAHPERYRMVFLNQDQGGVGEALYVDSSNIVERFGVFSELIAAMQAQGSARAGAPQALGEALICALLGITHALLTIPEYPWQSRERLLDACLGIVDAR